MEQTVKDLEGDLKAILNNASGKKIPGIDEIDTKLGDFFEAYCIHTLIQKGGFSSDQFRAQVKIQQIHNPLLSDEFAIKQLKLTQTYVEKFKKEKGISTSESESASGNPDPKRIHQTKKQNKKQNEDERNTQDPKSFEVDLTIWGVKPAEALHFLEQLDQVKSLVEEKPFKDLINELTENNDQIGEVVFLFELGNDIFTNLDHKFSQIMRYIHYYESYRMEKKLAKTMYIYGFVTNCPVEKFNEIKSLKQYLDVINKKIETVFALPEGGEKKDAKLKFLQDEKRSFVFLSEFVQTFQRNLSTPNGLYGIPNLLFIHLPGFSRASVLAILEEKENEIEELKKKVSELKIELEVRNSTISGMLAEIERSGQEGPKMEEGELEKGISNEGSN